MAYQNDGNHHMTRDRLIMPLLLPLTAAVVTAVLIVGVGELLLATNTEAMTIGDEHIVMPVFIALGLALVVLAGAAVAARTVAKGDDEL